MWDLDIRFYISLFSDISCASILRKAASALRKSRGEMENWSKKDKVINTQVSTFLGTLADFEWKCE